jgi:translation initiation factor 2 beta subunit (eIF-2beta)/eIF-5
MVGQCIGTPGTLPPIVGEILVKVRRLKRDIYSFAPATVGEKISVCSGVLTVDGTVAEIPDKKHMKIKLDKPLCINTMEKVSIMRYNPEAEKKLLECCGDVIDLEEWPTIIYNTAPDINEQLNRVPRWIPMEHPSFNQQTISYTDMLEDLFDKKDEEMNSQHRLQLVQPKLEKIPKHTVIKNWPDVWPRFDNQLTKIPFDTHLKEFIEQELSTTSAINGQGQLVLAGTWKLPGLLTILRRYTTLYKTCKQCKGTDTGLIKSGKVMKVKCATCLAENFVDNT